MALLARATGRIFFLSNNYYCNMIVNCFKEKLFKKKFSKILSFNSDLSSVRFSHTDLSDVQTSKSKYVMYDKLLIQRRLEARRSVLIEVQSDKSCTELYTYCCQFGNISRIFHYTNRGMERHFVLIEFEYQENVDAVLAASTHVNHEQIIPVQSSMLWFRNSIQRTEKGTSTVLRNLSLPKYCCKLLSDIEVFKSLLAAKSISEQIILLYRATKLNDVGIRLRFYTAYQIERGFQGLFPNIAVLPFGSSVNGFGKQGCDLDLSAIFEEDKTEKTASRLVFQTKSFLTHERQQIKILMETIADMMRLFIPGVTNVRKILDARVPIIKFDHMLSGIECDLTITNMSAYYMSELLYMYGEMDWRVRPLIFTIRKWAECLKLTSKNTPGPWITNFSLSLMVIFFLQQKKILPALNLLKTYATKDDVRVADICVDCTFQRDISRIPNSNILNTQSLDVLLLEFFTYYGNFDFETKALSLREGKPISKPEYSALFICNPLEITLNVSKNVKFEELERIKIAMRSASWHLEASDSNKQDKWGLLRLFTEKNINQLENGTNVRRNSGKINIEALFENDDDMQSTRQKLNHIKKHRRSKTKMP